jgi:hypothetical protein
MKPEDIWLRAARALLHMGIVALGLASIVGSGGGGAIGFPDTSCFNLSQGCGTPLPAQPTASVSPQRPIVQVGMPLHFDVTTDVSSASYQWCRQPSGTTVCTDIAGANGSGYTLAAANLADDGTIYKVTVSGSSGTARAGSLVAVSAMPAVVLTDTDFADGIWSLTAVASPPLPSLRFSASRPVMGGKPGPYRLLSLDLPLEVRTVTLIDINTAALYDPAMQGAVYLIEFSLDCNNIAVTRDPYYLNYWLPALEQGGRRFLPDRNAGASCYSPGWNTRGWLGFEATGFKLIDGPACGAGDACPDFSTNGLPIRLGLAYNVELRAVSPSASAPPHFEQGLDNFKATVWRH